MGSTSKTPPHGRRTTDPEADLELDEAEERHPGTSAATRDDDDDDDETIAKPRTNQQRVGEDADWSSLRVAIVSTCAVSTPPSAYGGTELVVANLARELTLLGHRPTVFATGDSTCPGAHRNVLFPTPVWPPDGLAELRHAAASWEVIAALGNFDVVHLNHAGGLPFTRFFHSTPVITTVHHERDPQVARHYASYPDVAFVAISRRQAELSWEVPFRAVVHHGLEPDLYPLGPGGQRCAFVGRFAPEKGTHIAIDAARMAGRSIALGGEAHPVERRYFTREIEPRLRGDDVLWQGEVNHERKVDLLGRSSCCLVPIQWEEPFGLVMIEAMLVGTPVVAFACGAAPEIVEEGVTGFLVHSVEEMSQRIRDAEKLDRRACRERARERWSSARMTRDYVDVYRQAIAAWRERRLRTSTANGGPGNGNGNGNGESRVRRPPQVQVMQRSRAGGGALPRSETDSRTNKESEDWHGARGSSALNGD